MNPRRFGHHLRGYKTLTKLVQWQDIYRYSASGAGLSLIEFQDDSPTQSILVLSPHPDDAAFGCGGMISLHSKHHDTVNVIFITDGSRGTKFGRRDKSLVDVRRAEAEDSLHHLGENIASQFWGFPDGGFVVNKTTIGLLRGVLTDTRPDVVYAPWYADEHNDHNALIPLMVEVLGQMNLNHAPEIRQYEVWSPLIPNRIVGIEGVLENKIKAMDAHKSQENLRVYRDGILGLNAYRGASAGLSEPAEAFLELTGDRLMHFYETIVKPRQ